MQSPVSSLTRWPPPTPCSLAGTTSLGQADSVSGRLCPLPPLLPRHRAPPHPSAGPPLHPANLQGLDGVVVSGQLAVHALGVDGQALPHAGQVPLALVPELLDLHQEALAELGLHDDHVFEDQAEETSERN